MNLKVIEIEKSPSGYYKLRLENRERLLLTDSNYYEMFHGQLVAFESTSGNFYNTSVLDNVIHFEQIQ